MPTWLEFRRVLFRSVREHVVGGVRAACGSFKLVHTLSSAVVQKRSEDRRVGRERRPRPARHKAEHDVGDAYVAGVQTCPLPICPRARCWWSSSRLCQLQTGTHLEFRRCSKEIGRPSCREGAATPPRPPQSRTRRRRCLRGWSSDVSSSDLSASTLLVEFEPLVPASNWYTP